MDNLHLNDDQLYYLRSLCQAVYQETGVWHELHSRDEIIKLLRYSSMAPFEVIYGYFCCFVNLLDDKQYKTFKAENILMPQDLANYNGDERPDLRIV